MRVVVHIPLSGWAPTFHASEKTTVADVKQLLVESRQTGFALDEIKLHLNGDFRLPMC